MPRPGRKTYTVYYDDATYLSYDFTKKDYDTISDALLYSKPAVKLSIGVIVSKGIRSVIEQRVKADVPQHEGANPELDQEAIDWAKAAKLADNLREELDLEGEEDYIGGMI